MNIDWSKYKRFFAFGCSFTSYMWPTWADVVSKEMPSAEFFNLGVSGSGNLLISLRIAEANTRFKFTDTDLIMVMFTTYTREDRWVKGKWVQAGNIYNNDIYPKDWVRDFCDERGYLIRDAALLENTIRYLESLPCDSHCMLSVPFREGSNECDSPYQNENSDVADLYAETLSKFPPSMYELELKNMWAPDYTGFVDGHPTTLRYYNYLEKIGLPLSASTKQYALDATQILTESKSRNILPTMFPEQDANMAKASRLMY